MVGASSPICVLLNYTKLSKTSIVMRILKLKIIPIKVFVRRVAGVTYTIDPRGLSKGYIGNSKLEIYMQAYLRKQIQRINWQGSPAAS